MSPEVALNRISPMLSPFISSVVRNGKVGLDATNCLRITDLKSGCTSLTPGPNCDRFKLHIPYAGETLKWDIIFNAQYPELPPDFIFGEDAEFLPDPSALHNLASWNPSNPECLLLVVKELVQQYHQFQCSRLRESSRLMFEYQTLLEEPQYGENMEIYAGKKNNWTGEFSARFLLKLPVDFSNIPTYLLKDVNEDPGEDVALLSVSFEDTEATQVYPKLYLSPRIEHRKKKETWDSLPCAWVQTEPAVSWHLSGQPRAGDREATGCLALGGSSALHIPAFPGGGCLIDYVPQVCHLLTNKVQYVIQGYHKRREYIAAFLSHFGTGVVEYDAEGFTKLTLLLMWKDFCFLVHIDLPLFFPRDQPTLTFQSVYHFTNSGQLYSQAQKNYPYSPRWDGNEMAKRANVQWTCVNASCNPVAIRSYLNYSREGLAEGPAEDAVDGMACGVTERCAPCFPGPTAQPGKAYFKTFVPQFQEAAFANGKL
ncbi:BRISC and BRCA1-A complex member 2 isoform X3 [Felis catus]|uniref:BRISC and BRCA1-A complex member 2 isoform X3 n=1 Tax=Felis catus TaxID=9685 RepID=UPI001D19A67D|nr:BRISC and BRCA1-A complex member 2 isoform X3 [Felis catus]